MEYDNGPSEFVMCPGCRNYRRAAVDCSHCPEREGTGGGMGWPETFAIIGQFAALAFIVHSCTQMGK